MARKQKISKQEQLKLDAARQSNDGTPRFIVHVPDEGSQVFDQNQLRKYSSLVFVEHAFLYGKEHNKAAVSKLFSV